MSNFWYPTPADQYNATEAYISFASGVAILNNPQATQPIHAVEVCPDTNVEQLTEIAHFAAGLMLRGINGFIRASSPPELRSSFPKMEQNYDIVLPHMGRSIAWVYDKYPDRMRALNPYFGTLRPGAMLNAAVYKNACHGRYDRFKIGKLLEPFRPHRILAPIIDNISLKKS